MMIRTSERRATIRMAASYVATLRTRHRIIARGKTANISEGGVLVIVHRNPRLPSDGQELLVDLIIPADPAAGTKREVTYLCRVTRHEELAHLMAIGLAFIRKIA